MLHVPAGIRDEIESHLRSAIPDEGVGLLAVDRDLRDVPGAGPVTAVHFFRGTNIDASPARYTMEPEEVIAALRIIREREWRLGGIVHSHLAGPATPSPVDLQEAYYPDALMIVVSFATSPADMRAWRSGDGDGPIEVAIRTE